MSCALRHACTYPVSTQKGVADLCLYKLQCNVYIGIKDFLAM